MVDLVTESDGSVNDDDFACSGPPKTDGSPPRMWRDWYVYPDCRSLLSERSPSEHGRLEDPSEDCDEFIS